jgi:hypothetical protein
MWELQVFLHPVPHKVPVHKIQSSAKMYIAEPGKHSRLTHANAAAVTRHIALPVQTHPFALQVSWR